MVQTLNTEGFLFTEVAGEWALVSAEFGDGHESAKLTGTGDGSRVWTLRIDALPDDATLVPGLAFDQGFLLTEADNYLLLEGGGKLLLDTLLPRSQYLWRFFRRSKAAGNEPFWLELDDPRDGVRKQFLASFADNRLNYTILCAKLYATGLQLHERRLSGITSPIPVT